LWLSPIYPSPQADFGYDISDYTGVDPVYGTFSDFDALVSSAHERGIRVLMDVPASHTSLEHPWLPRPSRLVHLVAGRRPAEQLDRDVRTPGMVARPVGRGWYLRSSYPEQPDLDWRVPGVREAMASVVRFWLNRGVDARGLGSAATWLTTRYRRFRATSSSIGDAKFAVGRPGNGLRNPYQG